MSNRHLKLSIPSAKFFIFLHKPPRPHLPHLYKWRIHFSNLSGQNLDSSFSHNPIQSIRKKKLNISQIQSILINSTAAIISSYLDYYNSLLSALCIVVDTAGCSPQSIIFSFHCFWIDTFPILLVACCEHVMKSWAKELKKKGCVPLLR